jgi:hypothetical protein
MTKDEKISAAAAQADTEDKLWSLFFTEEMLDLIVQHTNECIAEEVEHLQYPPERMRKSPYISPIDKVGDNPLVTPLHILANPSLSNSPPYFCSY